MKRSLEFIHSSIAIRIFITVIFSVPEYEIVHPYTVDHNARRSQNARKSLHHTKPMYVHFNAFGLDFHMNITLNKDLVPAEHFIEHHGVNGVKRIKGRAGTYSIGKVVSDTESNVALDHTSGMVSFHCLLFNLISRVFLRHILFMKPNEHPGTLRSNVPRKWVHQQPLLISRLLSKANRQKMAVALVLILQEMLNWETTKKNTLRTLFQPF